jgi:hypothetical protein
VKMLLTQNMMGTMFFLFYLGTILIGHFLGNYGRSITPTYSLEVTVCLYEAYEFDNKHCILLFKNKLAMFIEFANTCV